MWGKYKHNKKHGTKILREVEDPERFDLDRPEFRIVSNEIWERAQVIAIDNRVVRTPKKYLLRNHLWCECGERMIGNGKYYRCKSSKHGKDNNCGNGSLRKGEIENDVWKLVTDCIYNPSDLYDRLWDTLEQGSIAQTELIVQAEDISKSIAAKNRQIASIALSISRAEGERMIAALLKQGQTLEQELMILEQEHTDIISGLQADVVDPDELNQAVHVKVLDWMQDLDTADYNRKRTILGELNAKVFKFYPETAERKGHPWALVVSINGVSCNTTTGDNTEIRVSTTL